MPLDEIKVVIIGQDPYPNPKHAIGLAFATPPEEKTPYSLSIIIDVLALTMSYDITLDLDKPWPNKDLQHWVDQGVFLLNRSLTCEQGKSNSHAKYWKGFTDLIVKTISENTTNVVWMLWGKNAQEVEPLISDNHHILKCNHPAASRYGDEGFKNSNHFEIANKLLNKPIEWVLKPKNYV